jgi:hypothetical protein
VSAVAAAFAVAVADLREDMLSTSCVVLPPFFFYLPERENLSGVSGPCLMRSSK